MNINEPLVSIIMNCFNGEKYLKCSIESVINQSYKNWELIFWDNKSTDNSIKIANSYNDIRIKCYCSKKFVKLYEARNLAIKNANGKFIAFLDVDDWWDPLKIEKQIKLFEDEDIGFSCTNYWRVIGNQKKPFKRTIIPSGNVTQKILDEYPVGILTLMVRADALKKLEYICDSSLHIIGDFDLVFRLSLNSSMGVIQDKLAYYRIHNENESGKSKQLQIEEYKYWIDKFNNNKFYVKNFNIDKLFDEVKYMSLIIKLDELNIAEFMKNCSSIKYLRYRIKFAIKYLSYRVQH